MDHRVKHLLGTGNQVVDLGCGSGQLLSDLSDSFQQRIGLDVSRCRLEGSGGGEQIDWVFYEADLNAVFPLESGTVDAVIANQVIEHIVDPVAFVREIYRILRPGGRCIITTPNIRYLSHIASLLLSGNGPRTACGNTIDGPWDDGHIHYFTHKDLREVFTSVGFAKVQSSALINDPNSNPLRRALNTAAVTYTVREFLSGNILLLAIK
jgi:SAM-dependent methyltransferase